MSRYSPKNPKPSNMNVEIITDLLTVEIRSFLDNLLVRDEKTGIFPIGSSIARSVISDCKKIIRLISAIDVIYTYIDANE